MSHWPIHPKPKEDELISSWIVRLAIAHGIKLQCFCTSVWGQNLNVWNRDIDKFPVPEMFLTLSKKTLTPLERVLDTHLSSYEGKLYHRHNPYGNQNWILPVRIFHRLRQSHGQQFCPHCLKEDGYLRKRWRLALLTCCEIHGTRMLDRCPQCQLPLHFHRDDMGTRGFLGKKNPHLCFNCSFDLGQAPAEKVHNDEVARQKAWLKIINAGQALLSDDSIVPGPEYFDVVRHLAKLCVSKYAFARNIGEHAATAMGLDWKKPARRDLNASLEALSSFDRAQILHISSWLLEKWPKRFIDFCIEHEIFSSALTKDFKDPPLWYLSVVKKHLKREIWKGRPDPCRSKRASKWKSIHKINRVLAKTRRLKSHAC